MADTLTAPGKLDKTVRTAAQAVANAKGNLSQAARQLGISRQTLYRKLGAQQQLKH